MKETELPILYSFRRCPYAMRARMAISYAQIKVELREILLKDKPKSMLAASSKGTVPVLILPYSKVIDESREIMTWALSQNDPQLWFYGLSSDSQQQANNLINNNDTTFKLWLDKYKYTTRHPEFPKSYYRKKGEIFLIKLEQHLTEQNYLLGNKISIADIALFPFIRQFYFVDELWFENSQYIRLKHWLKTLLNTPLFTNIMRKYPVWKYGDPINTFPK